MDPHQNAWNSFLATGKIDDYMAYCQARKKEMTDASGGVCFADAANNERHRPPGQKDGR